MIVRLEVRVRDMITLVGQRSGNPTRPPSCGPAKSGFIRGTANSSPKESGRLAHLCDERAKASTTCGLPSGRLSMSPGSTHQQRDRTSHTACRRAVLRRNGSSGTQSGGVVHGSLAVLATCRMHGLDLFAYLAAVCTASVAGLAVPQLLPAPS